MNIAILRNKWGRAIHPNPKRKNEILLRWPADGDLKVTGKAVSTLTSDAGVESDASSNGSKQFSTKGSGVKRTAGKKRVIIISKAKKGSGAISKGVERTCGKRPITQCEFRLDAKILRGSGTAR